MVGISASEYSRPPAVGSWDKRVPVVATGLCACKEIGLAASLSQSRQVDFEARLIERLSEFAYLDLCSIACKVYFRKPYVN